MTMMNTNHTEKPFTFTEAAAIADIAAISTAIDKYTAQLIGLAKSYQLTTWDIEIAATEIIGIRKASLMIKCWLLLNHLVIWFYLIFYVRQAAFSLV